MEETLVSYPPRKGSER
uniref:Uncharacterized protein n=1 Tax=Arundo donax TaxID=35708 RepID=A0A0A9HL18_ARUDO